MDNPLSHLVGRHLTAIGEAHECYQPLGMAHATELRLSGRRFVFGSWAFVIHNRITLCGACALSDLIELVVADVWQSESSLGLRFHGGAALTVDLRDDAYTGPEAAVLSGPDGEIIVW